MKFIVLVAPQIINNVGGIARTAEGLGYNIIIIDNERRYNFTTYNKKKLHILNSSSTGAFGRIRNDILVFNTISECDQYLDGIKCISFATSSRRDKIITDQQLPDGNFAIWFGNEARGLPEDVLSNKVCITIPLCDSVESLNIGVAVGIVLYALSEHKIILSS